MHRPQLLCSGAIVAACLVGQPPVTGDADRLIYRAAFEAVVKPESERLSGSTPPEAPPLVVYDRTIPVCANSRPGPPSLDCVCLELEAFEGVHRSQATLPFASSIREGTRATLASAFRDRNQRPQPFPGDALAAARTVSAAYVVAAARGSRREGVIRFSQPARSGDGFALVFASYTCGDGCAQGWLILLTDANGMWRVVDKYLTWIS